MTEITKKRGWMTTSIILFIITLTSTAFNYALLKSREKTDVIIQKNNEIVRVALPKIQNQIEAITKEAPPILNFSKNDTVFMPQIKMQLDTVQFALDKGVIRKQLILAKDSIRILKENIKALVVDKQQYVATVEKEFKALEFTAKNKDSFVSPSRNFVRVPDPTNTKKYKDYELKSDESYQLMIQLRAAHNPVTGRKLAGVGAELKFNRFSVNFVNNYDFSLHTYFNPTFGLRYDVLRFPIR